MLDRARRCRALLLHGVLAAGRDVLRMKHRGEGKCHVELHHMHIRARGETQGKPTPKGLHRDGADYVLIMLVVKRRIYGGVTKTID